MSPIEVLEKNGPIILGQPHGGIFIPPVLSSRLNERGRHLADTDWHINRLYKGLLPSATVVKANFSRYFIDANRDPSGNSLYPGKNTTGLCPIIDFEGEPIYNEGEEPSEEEIEQRRKAFHSVYHAALKKQIERVRKLHGVVLLFDCHSIRSRLPFLFEGVLPDFNIGTNNGRTCGIEIEEATVEVCLTAKDYKTMLNGRFKGGWTTRNYGNPSEGIHAIQLEIAQRTYMEETSPWSYRIELANTLRKKLKSLLVSLEDVVNGNVKSNVNTQNV